MKHKPIVALIAVLVLAACNSSPAPTAPATNPPPTPTQLIVAPTIDATAKPTPVASATVPAPPIGQPADAKAAIVAALEALDKNGPYRMTITASSEPGGPVTLEVVPPDRSRYTGSVDGKPVEVINIGTAAYVLDPDGTWQTSTTSDSDAATLLNDPAILNSLTDVEVLPPQTINGMLTTVYAFVDATAPEAKVILWVSEDKGRPVQMQTTSTDETVLYVIEYDAGITVEPPVK
ncbi:MAG: hypothetical protein HGB05_11400 [Chloroflexi bacterium]|nr:hypothetical protein [Chloroflexota bacterium]